MKANFDKPVKTEWIEGEPHKMRLLDSVTFTDKTGKLWTANENDIINGASIPKFFWRVIGSPFVGHYRRPSVVHDVFCESGSEPHKDVHNMFYEAMLIDGVPKLKAKAMYWAVRLGGPKW
jgi:hypothetical protein